MKKTWIAAAMSVLLMQTAAVQAEEPAEPAYIYTCDFEHLTTAAMKTESAISFAQKSSEITIEELDGSKVLRYHHKELAQSEDCYTDFLGGTKNHGLESVYCFRYDFRYTGTLGCGWQILCSRQTPASGTQFQQAGFINGEGALTVNNSDAALTLEPDRWYTFAVVMNEIENLFDLYVDGVLLAEAVPYTISDASEKYAHLLRIGFNGGTADCTAYIDNVRVSNTSVPYEVAAPEITVVAGEAKDVIADFPLPEYTAETSISQPVWYILGTTASLILAASGYLLLRKLNTH